MGFFSDVLGGSLPPALSNNNANTAVSSLGTNAQQGNNYMNAYGQQGQQGIAGGMSALNSGIQNLTPVSNWFQTIMGGNKSATLNQMQPQIQQTEGGGLNTALQTASTLSPRGGGRSSTLFDLPFAAQQQIAQQYGSARAGGTGGGAAASVPAGSTIGGLVPVTAIPTIVGLPCAGSTHVAAMVPTISAGVLTFTYTCN